MSQQTVNFGGTQVAEPPAPLLPQGDAGSGGDDNRRKLVVVGAVAGVVVLLLAAFFLLKGGGSSKSDNGFVVPHTPVKGPAAAAAAPVVKLPRHVVVPVGRDPFKALYTAPVAAAAGSTSSSSSSTTTPTSTGGSTSTTSSGTTTTTTTTPTYHPVWIQLRAVSTTATFLVGYSNGKTFRAFQFDNVKPQHSFAGTFQLLSIRKGVVTLKFGDGTPFMLDMTHNSMVVD